MTASGPDFRQTWLWRQAFVNPRSDSGRLIRAALIYNTRIVLLRRRVSSIIFIKVRLVSFVPFQQTAVVARVEPATHKRG
jgi:hypothetical protein